jgi:hypothetical protein
VQSKRLGCEYGKALDSAMKIKLKNLTCCQLNHLPTVELWTFGEFKGMHISKPPVPNWLRADSNICRGQPWRQLIEIVVDENWLDRFGPTRYDFATKDALLRRTLVRAGTWLLSHSNNSLQCMRGQERLKKAANDSPH